MTIQKKNITFDLNAYLKKAKEKDRRNKKALRERASEVVPGDLYTYDAIAQPENGQVYWAITHQHPENVDLFYTVLADTFPMEGYGDMALPNSAMIGPLRLRLGYGLWIMKELFEGTRQVGIIEPHFIKRAMTLLNRMATQAYVPTSAQLETEDDLDYNRWIESVEPCLFSLRAIRDQLAEVEVTEKSDTPSVLSEFADRIRAAVQEIGHSLSALPTMVVGAAVGGIFSSLPPRLICGVRSMRGAHTANEETEPIPFRVNIDDAIVTGQIHLSQEDGISIQTQSMKHGKPVKNITIRLDDIEAKRPKPILVIKTEADGAADGGPESFYSSHKHRITFRHRSHVRSIDF